MTCIGYFERWTMVVRWAILGLFLLSPAAYGSPVLETTDDSQAVHLPAILLHNVLSSRPLSDDMRAMRSLLKREPLTVGSDYNPDFDPGVWSKANVNLFDMDLDDVTHEVDLVHVNRVNLIRVTLEVMGLTDTLTISGEDDEAFFQIGPPPTIKQVALDVQDGAAQVAVPLATERKSSSVVFGFFEKLFLSAAEMLGRASGRAGD